jgi:hypothetical protein
MYLSALHFDDTRHIRRSFKSKLPITDTGPMTIYAITDSVALDGNFQKLASSI